MPGPSIVRRATPADREGVWKLFKLLHQENGVFTLSERKLNWLLDRILNPDAIADDDQGLRGFMGVIGPPDALEGFILLVISQNWYSDDFHLEELANFVHPDHRKSNHAKTLLSYSRHLADHTAIPLLIGIISNERTAAKVRLYKRQLPEAGAFFLYGATTGTNREHSVSS